jgi:DNA topoisomerase-3
MQMICDGVRHKREVLDQSVEEYKEVYIKARREFDTIVEVS